MIEEKSDKFGSYLFSKKDSKVDIESMLKGLDFLDINKSLPKRLRILEDATNVKVTFDKKDIERILDRLKEVSRKYISIRHAVVQNSPENTALAILLCKRLKSDIYKLGVFSTKQGALEWLNKSSSTPSPNY